MNLIISNAFGLIALILLACSYQNKEKEKFLFFQLLANTAYLLQYAFVSALTACAMNGIAIVKSIIFYIEEKNSKKHTKLHSIKSKSKNNKKIQNKVMYKKIRKRELTEFIIIENVTIIAGIVTYENYLSLIPTFIGIVFTYAMWQKNLTVTYSIASIVPLGWIYYNIQYNTYTGALGSLFEMAAAIVGCIRYVRNSKKDKNKNKFKSKNKNKK